MSLQERDNEARAAAMSLLVEGEATLSEVAELAGASRQLVRYWADRAGIDWQRSRKANLAKKWRKKIGKGRAIRAPARRRLV